MARPRPRLLRNYLKLRSSGKSSDGDIGAASASLSPTDQTGQSAALHPPKGRREHSLLFASSSGDECSGPALSIHLFVVQPRYRRRQGQVYQNRFALFEVIADEADGDWQEKGRARRHCSWHLFVICIKQHGHGGDAPQLVECCEI